MENLELAVSLRVEKRIPEAIEVLTNLLAVSPVDELLDIGPELSFWVRSC